MDLLDLKNIKSLSSKVADGVRYIEAEVLEEPGACVLCQAPDPYRHDSREQAFADAPIRGQPVRILFHRRRYRCRVCKKTFFEPLLGFSVKRNMTQRLVHYIARDALIRTFADVARDVAVDVQTVRGVFLDFSSWLRTNHPIATPRIMGIDEAKRAGVLCTVLTDLERREYFDMLPSRKAKPLNAYLAQLPEKELVKVVAMDLHLGFVTAIGKHLPKAVRVADRYHVARLAQDAFDKAHVAARKGLDTGDRLGMFRKRGLLAQRDRTLSEPERQRVIETLQPFPILVAAYEAKESFLQIYDAPDRESAEQALDAWLDRLPRELSGYFRAVTLAASNSREIILNYFEHRYTNAFTEAANGISKLLQRTGRGYGFEVMRVKLLYGKRGQKVDLSDYDTDNASERGSGALGYSRVSASYQPNHVPPARKRARRGPQFSRIDQLIDEGYFDVGNGDISDELEPLTKSFAASS